ncbi:hypothetical protein NTK89_002729 [Vibrio fluvialis]|nr:hypothetical protein [Vibrio fluvialis]
MKKIMLSLVCSMIVSTSVYAVEVTEIKSIQYIDVNSINDIYVSTETSWGVEVCPTVKTLKIKDGVASDRYFQLALAAQKSPGLKLRAHGECNGSYFLVEYLSLVN